MNDDLTRTTLGRHSTSIILGGTGITQSAEVASGKVA